MIKNASRLPKVYFGLHMAVGVAEYSDPNNNDGKPYRIFIDETAIKKMDSTFAGRPVYVDHVDNVDLTKLQEEADGYVVKSFYNQFDGKHWAEFMVVSDRGHQAIAQGWKLSNAYHIRNSSVGGDWHNVDYQQEVIDGEYEHLAIVANPRYKESIILTPEQFKAYNNEKELELKKLSNSKTKGEKSMFNFFKKTKVENDSELETMSVTLPKSKVEKLLSTIINEADEKEMKDKEEKPMCNVDHYVDCDGEMKKVNELVEAYKELNMKYNELMKKDETKKEESEDKKENLDESDKDAKKEEKKEDEKKVNSDFFETLLNAKDNAMRPAVQFDSIVDQVARGKSRYGSK